MVRTIGYYALTAFASAYGLFFLGVTWPSG